MIPGNDKIPHTRAFVLAGTNIRPESHLKAAVRQLRNRTTVSGLSTVYQTKPVGLEDQPDFLNVAIELRTERDAHELRTLLKSIEQELGRDRSGPRNGPRKIDLDLVLFGQEIIHDDQLNIPDPDVTGHAHAAIPLAELAPAFIHPEEDRTMSDIADDVPDQANLTPRPDVLLSG
jgi:2-amino-4-hydroxy-6-hydroxymethyldihydropteridine diphosphokinase